MCFEVPALAPPGGAGNDKKSQSNNDDGNDNDDLGIMDIDEADKKPGKLKLLAISKAFATYYKV